MQHLYNRKYLIFIPKIFVFTTLFIYFFLWDLLNNYYFSILIPSLVLIFFKIDSLYFNKKILYTSLFVFSVIFIQSIIYRSDYNLFSTDYNFYLKLFLFAGIFIFCKFFIYYIKNQIYYLILSFSIIYFIINIFHGITNLETIHSFNLLGNYRCHYGTGFFRNNIIFNENSHFGMVGVALTYYLLFISSTAKNFIWKIFLVIIVISFLYNSSTTYLIGYIFSFIAIYICCLKKINKNFIILTSTYLLLILYILFNSSSCSVRIKDSFKIVDVYFALDKDKNQSIQSHTSDEKYESRDLISEEFFKLYNKYRTQLNKYSNSIDNYGIKSSEAFKEKNKADQLRIELVKLDNEKFKLLEKNLSHNLTSQVYLRSLFILRESLKKKPLGWGAFNYEISYLDNIYEIPYINPVIVTLNNKDASNNFVKLLSEFGIFGFLLLFFITFACLSKKIEYNFKIFLIPIIITQLIRGSGYFAGGFFIAVSILILLYTSNSKKLLNDNIRN